ncbi:MAG: VWA domain-containing protein, partial [Terriglobales bacterium]
MRPWRSWGVVFLLAAGLSGQQVFHATTNLVNVRFTAWDAAGLIVNDLKPDELQVSDDGIPEKIAFFNHSQTLPLAIGIVVDISGSQSHFGKQHEQDLTKFLQAILRPGDRAFLVYFDDVIRVISEPAPVAATLLWNLQHFSEKYAYRELGPKLDRDGGTALFDAVADGAQELLGRESGQRVLLLYSDGMDNSSAADEMTVVAAAQKSDVVIYTIRYTADRKFNARDQYGVKVMDRLAAETGGLSFDARAIKPEKYLPEI